MHYTDVEIERAKTMFAREMGKSDRGGMAVAAMAGMSRPNKINQVTHQRTCRDYLQRARRAVQKERAT